MSRNSTGFIKRGSVMFLWATQFRILKENVLKYATAANSVVIPVQAILASRSWTTQVFRIWHNAGKYMEI